MHEKLENLSSMIDKLIEQNFKLKTESKSLRNRVQNLESEILKLQKENKNLIIKKNNNE
jgi:regulator of replication initiation timing